MIKGGHFLLAMVFFIRKMNYFTENYLYLATMNNHFAGIFAALQLPSIVIHSCQLVTWIVFHAISMREETSSLFSLPTMHTHTASISSNLLI